jgi:hypothetical protein
MHKLSMAPLLLATAALAWLGMGPARASDRLSPPGASRATPAGSPGAEHRQLAALAGRWSVTQSLWTDAARPPVIDHGVATFAPILGGRHLRQDLRIDSKGAPFEGVGYLGYDSATGKYDSVWMDVNFTGTIVAHGGYDAARRTYDFTADVPDPGRPGATRPLREEMRILDADHFSYAYYERHGGKETLAVMLEYTRLK